MPEFWRVLPTLALPSLFNHGGTWVALRCE